ncbi:MAG: hypothetical protein WCJ84_06160 [Candidatus Peregrinibacteria bacterium]
MTPATPRTINEVMIPTVPKAVKAEPKAVMIFSTTVVRAVPKAAVAVTSDTGIEFLVKGQNPIPKNRSVHLYQGWDN